MQLQVKSKPETDNKIPRCLYRLTYIGNVLITLLRIITDTCPSNINVIIEQEDTRTKEQENLFRTYERDDIQKIKSHTSEGL